MNAALDVLQSPHQHINRDRLWQSLMDLAKLGATPKGGVCRLALTDLDRKARDLFVQWCEAAGCTVTIDGIVSQGKGPRESTRLGLAFIPEDRLKTGLSPSLRSKCFVRVSLLRSLYIVIFLHVCQP